MSKQRGDIAGRAFTSGLVGNQAQQIQNSTPDNLNFTGLQMPVKSESKGFDSVVEDTPDGRRLTGVIDKTTGNVLPVAKPALGGGQRAMEVARLQKLRATDPEEFERLKAAAMGGR